MAADTIGVKTVIRGANFLRAITIKCLPSQIPRRRSVIAVVDGIYAAHRSLASLFFDDMRDESGRDKY